MGAVMIKSTSHFGWGWHTVSCVSWQSYYNREFCFLPAFLSVPWESLKWSVLFCHWDFQAETAAMQSLLVPPFTQGWYVQRRNDQGALRGNSCLSHSKQRRLQIKAKPEHMVGCWAPENRILPHSSLHYQIPSQELAWERRPSSLFYFVHLLLILAMITSNRKPEEQRIWIQYLCCDLA